MHYIMINYQWIAVQKSAVILAAINSMCEKCIPSMDCAICDLYAEGMAAEAEVENINYEFPVREVCAGCKYVETVKKHGDHPACDSCVHAEEVDHSQMIEAIPDPDLPF